MFFKKKTDESEGISEARKKMDAAERQAKWEELEKLVSAQESEHLGAKSEETDATDETETDKTEDDAFEPTGETVTLSLDAHDLRNTDGSEFASDLKVDMADDAPILDVTPDLPVGVTAMMPSKTFKPSAEFRPSTPVDVTYASVGSNDSSEPSASDDPAVEEEASISHLVGEDVEVEIFDEDPEEFIPTPPPVNRHDRADIGTMRLDVARISADIQSGEELYRRAQQRIEKLTGFVERAEIDFSLLNRLEPENRRLKARNRTLEREIDSSDQKLKVMRADLEDRERRLNEKTRVYEATVNKLSLAQKNLQEFERALASTRETAERSSLASERFQTSLEVERRENEILRKRLTDITTEAEGRQTAYIEAQKVADSLAQDCADFRHQAEMAQKDSDDLRKALATAQTQNNAMKADLVALHEDIRTFKTQSEFTIISREDEMTALQEQVAHLNKQIDIKDEIVRNAARDVQELRKVRTAQDLERERLEAQVQTQAFQIEELTTELVRTKEDVTSFDRRYRDVATAMSVSQSRRTPEPVPPVDIQPAQPDELDDLSTEDIEDRIMDFRLGLRSDIA